MGFSRAKVLFGGRSVGPMLCASAVLCFSVALALSGGCPGRGIVDGCPDDQTCNDDDPCTDDDCSNGECSNTPIDDCCVLAADCDDNDPCTLNACGEDNLCTSVPIANCCNDEIDCDDGEVCDDNDCVAACSDDGDCPGDEVCNVETGLCVVADPCDSDNDCPDGQVCDTQTGECVEEVQLCDVDGDCDDDDPCTLDSCEGGECSFVAACSDGLSCTEDSCDPLTSACSYESTCPTGEQCDAGTGQCEPVNRCDSDADCPDDGVFCNGTESCGDDEFCASSGNPCSAGTTCNESTDACDALPPQCIEFTTAVETRNGTGGDDSFCAEWDALTSTPTLQTGDVGNGAAGADDLTVSFAFTAPTIVQPTLSGIEIITVTNNGIAITTLSASLINGVSTIRSEDSTNPSALVVSNLANVVDIVLQDTASGLTVQYAAGATSGSGISANSMDVDLMDTLGGPLTITTGAANGIESLVVRSTGAANTLASLVQNVGTTLATLNISGTAPLTIESPLPATVGNIAAASASGGVTLDVSANTGNMVINCGAGNDTITFGANYAQGDAVAGAAGVNTLVMTSAAAGVAANQTSVTGFSVLNLIDSLSNAVTTTRFGAITTVNIPQGVSAASNLTVGTGTTINLGSTEAPTDTTQALTVTGGAGTTDSATLVLRDHDMVQLTFSALETVNMQSSNRGDGSAADDGLNLIQGAVTVTPTSGTGTINLSGAANLTITGPVTVGTLNASSLGGALIMETTSAASINISTGPGNDTIFGSASGDTLSAGAGANIINGRSGIDTIGPLGSGVDTIRLNIAGFAGADRKLISGFATGVGGDVLQVSAAQLETLSGTDDFTTAASLQTHSASGAIAVSMDTEVVRVTSGTVANFTAANSLNGTNLLDASGDPDDSATVPVPGYFLFLVGDGSGNTGVYFADSGGDTEVVAAEMTLVAVLQGTSPASLDFSNFSNAN